MESAWIVVWLATKCNLGTSELADTHRSPGLLVLRY
jgi:hypothetical protein